LQWGSTWRDTLVVAITDSENTIRWIRRGYARNRYAAHLLRLLSRMQLTVGFTVWAKAVPSDHNEIPDCASRTWNSTGELDIAQAKRWNGLMQGYSGPTLTEVALDEEAKAVALPIGGEGCLRLPGESIAAYNALLSGDANDTGSPILGGRAGGSWMSKEDVGGVSFEEVNDGGVGWVSGGRAGGRVKSWARWRMDGTEVNRQTDSRIQE